MRRLTLLTAIPRPPYWATSPATAPAVEPLAIELERGAKKALDNAVARVPQSVPVTTILSRKPIREALLERLESGEYDLLVMGSRGRGALAASVLGSVSHFALNHNTVPVLIVHSPDADSDVRAARRRGGGRRAGRLSARRTPRRSAPSRSRRPAHRRCLTAVERSTRIPQTGSVAPWRRVSPISTANTASASTLRTSL